MKAFQRLQPQRSIEVVLPATRFGPTEPIGREHWRVIGTTDVDGKGTHHALASVDPFIFLDESKNPANAAGLGMGGHPHAGLVALTYLSPDLEGTAAGELHPWDNHGGEAKPNRAGGLYIIEAGRGVVHSEVNRTPHGTMHQFQLWMRGREDTLAKYQLHPPESIPVVALPDDAGHCRVLCGSQFGVSSPATPPTPMQYLHVAVRAGARTALTIPPHQRGLVYTMSGLGTFGASSVGARQLGLLSPAGEEASVLHIDNGGEDTLHALLVTGLPLTADGSAPVYKKLGHGGSFISESEDGARAMQARYEADAESFGKSSPAA